MKTKITIFLSSITILLILIFSFNYGLFQRTICVETQAVSINGIIKILKNDESFSGKNLCNFDDGMQIKSRGIVKDGKKINLWTEWNRNGQIKFERNYIDGIIGMEKTYQNGEVTSDIKYSYFENEKIKSKQSFKDGLANGKWIEWHENGKLLSEKNYIDDKLNGSWSQWHINGDKALEATYKNNKLDGKLTQWPVFPQITFNSFYKWEGRPYEFRWASDNANIVFYNNVNLTKTLDLSFVLGTLVDRDMLIKFNGQDLGQFKLVANRTAKYSYSLQLNPGVNTLNFVTAEPAIIPYGDDNRKLLFSFGKFIHENNETKSEKNYKKNKLDGKWIMWYSNGQKKSEKNYKNNKLDGKWIEWYSNGEQSLEALYKSDKLDGNWSQWSRKGKILLEKNYKEGECISENCFD
ncbi:toxin-antitoxin system YwqK family antitoxin [Candidatus Pseudothioglobus sp. Uisw_086]|uniref:toxin-antitoxin system YwqK family antitoxin n=1 Tax=Candidatus Pseudothioglobus sp. Uisw_086 TaxID=3230998 RepID=UPI003A8ADF11